jgi:predicted metal-dependent HD superfamily phosphohydrolase
MESPFMPAFESSWDRCWSSIGASGNGRSLMKRLIDAYSEEHRKYHTVQHLTECLSLLEQYRELAEYPAEVEIALWFHDAIYDVKAGDNETRSADWAERELQSAGVLSESIARVKDLISATMHSTLPSGQDQKLIVDIDLSILGASRERFIEYDSQVRDEYGWVPGIIYRRKRKEILMEFLSRNPIYNTSDLREAFEAQARKNLQYSLQRLDG